MMVRDHLPNGARKGMEKQVRFLLVSQRVRGPQLAGGGMVDANASATKSMVRFADDHG